MTEAGFAPLIGVYFTTIRPCKGRALQGLQSISYGCALSRLRFALDRFFNVLSLETFGTLSDGEFHTVAFFQGLVPVADDGRIVDKHIPAGSPLDESESLLVVEPLYFALLFALLFTHYPQTPFT